MDSISEKHIQNSKSQIMMILILCVATLLFAIFAMGWGSSNNLDLFTTMKILFGMESADELQSAIIWKLRFPRILMAIVGGALMPPMQGSMIDSPALIAGIPSVQTSFILPLICFIVIAIYGYRAHVKHNA